MNRKGWFYTAVICIAISVASFFTTVITYTTSNGELYNFSMVDIVNASQTFKDIVIDQYHGPKIVLLDSGQSSIFASVAVIAVACAIVGLFSLRVQRPNTWQFILTIIGLVGVAIPSFMLFIIVLSYGKYYEGKIGFGFAPIITPIAMAISVAAVIRRKNKVAEELRKEMEAKNLIWQAGELH